MLQAVTTNQLGVALTVKMNCLPLLERQGLAVGRFVKWYPAWWREPSKLELKEVVTKGLDWAILGRHPGGGGRSI